jgi:hypothetical protein
MPHLRATVLLAEEVGAVPGEGEVLRRGMPESAKYDERRATMTVPDRTTFESAYASQAPWDMGRTQR